MGRTPRFELRRDRSEKIKRQQFPVWIAASPPDISATNPVWLAPAKYFLYVSNFSRSKNYRAF